MKIEKDGYIYEAEYIPHRNSYRIFFSAKPYETVAYVDADEFPEEDITIIEED